MIYLDNCSTTRIRPEVLKEMEVALREDFYNPSSLHNYGYNVEKKIEKSREIISKTLNVEKDEIYFTSGGTESNNLAIGMAVETYKNRGNKIITSKIEHSSVLNYMKYLESNGFEVHYLNVDENGQIDLKELKDELTEDTILVSIMQVNNEIGTILDLERVRRVLDDVNSSAIFHVDGVQGYGKVKTKLKPIGIDLYSFSSHKIYGPKGVGGLYLSNDLNLNPIIHGGNQERGIRSGTENSPGIIAFGKAAKIIYENFDKESEYIRGIKEYFIKKILEEIPDIKINSNMNSSSPYIVNISIRNIRAEVLLHYLSEEGILISTSSACSSNGTEKSHVLNSIGLTDNEIEGTIRICFSYDINKEDIDKTIKIMKKYVEDIRNIMMR